MSEKENVGNLLKRIRYKLCMNQKKFAELIGVHQGAISLYELGKRKPGFSTIKIMVEKLKNKGIKISYSDLKD
jgi:transcriptional regulator with XRE-family HTH domain